MPLHASHIERVAAQTRLNVRFSKGWWQRIADETGCKLTTLSGIGRSDEYDPKVSELIKIERWFNVNGVKYVGPQGKPRTAPTQLDIEQQIARSEETAAA